MKLLKRRKKMKVDYFTKSWIELTSYCSKRKTWPMAIAEADRLLDKALKKKNYKGKTTGERLVSAQHDLTLNEEVWFSHKFTQKILEEDVDVRTLKKKDMLRVLAGFRAALRDLGALEKPDDK
ncbi:MAG TPA: hypothetical protein VFN31_02480 [Candidatus Saccharimonadales bacterium]|nr:hypothetical protein [Candidatus Saccharimonadales bacterium]